MYTPKPYPKWMYHRDGRSVIVQDPAEQEALGPDWATSPAAFDVSGPLPAADPGPSQSEDPFISAKPAKKPKKTRE